MTRRSRTEIMHDVLELITKGVTLRTHIMYQSNTSWNTIMPILKHLIDNDCIVYDGKHYHMLNKGKAVLNALYALRKMRP